MWLIMIQYNTQYLGICIDLCCVLIWLMMYLMLYDYHQ